MTFKEPFAGVCADCADMVSRATGNENNVVERIDFCPRHAKPLEFQPAGLADDFRKSAPDRCRLFHYFLEHIMLVSELI